MDIEETTIAKKKKKKMVSKDENIKMNVWSYNKNKIEMIVCEKHWHGTYRGETSKESVGLDMCKQG